MVASGNVVGLVCISCLHYLLASSLGLAKSRSSYLETRLSDYMREGIDEMRHLVILEESKEKLEGEYHSPSGGIHFLSEANDGNVSLTITTTEGVPVLSMKRPQSFSIMKTMTVGKSMYMLKMNKPNTCHPKYYDYVVPEGFQHMVESVLRRNHMTYRLLKHLNNSDTSEKRQEAVENLISSLEAELFIEAAKSVGRNVQILGSESPAALQFYVLAMRLEKIRDFMKVNNSKEEVDKEADTDYYPSHLSRQTCSGCTTGSCPFQSDESTKECSGMCGHECHCQSWVCGDCCVHQGCVDYDRCCAVHGIGSWECLTPFDFTCSGYSC